jgi:hypothetical protein
VHTGTGTASAVVRAVAIGAPYGPRADDPLPVDPASAVDTALDGLTGTTGTYAVAVEDRTTGTQAVYGTRHFDTASIVKADILATLLLHAQRQGGTLGARERALAGSMIRYSDNAATDALWQDIGGAPGLDAANRRLGLTGTTAGGGGLWGLTQTTAADQLRLLEMLFADGDGDAGTSPSPLTERSRTLARTLMSSVTPAQRWGVTAAADEPGSGEVKNGWLPRSTTGLWDINSIGRIHDAGHTLLVAVLSNGQHTMASGVDQAERLAVTAATALVEALDAPAAGPQRAG